MTAAYRVALRECCCCVAAVWRRRGRGVAAAVGQRGGSVGAEWGRLWAACGLCGSVLERREGCVRVGCCGVAAAWVKRGA